MSTTNPCDAYLNDPSHLDESEELARKTERDLRDFDLEQLDASGRNDATFLLGIVKTALVGGTGGAAVVTTGVVTAVAALAYLVMPLDLVPDVIPILGFGDDIAVLAAAVSLITGVGIGAAGATMGSAHRLVRRRSSDNSPDADPTAGVVAVDA